MTPFDTFSITGQGPLKLRIAAEEYFHRKDLPEQERTAYRAYLRLRKRSLLALCIESSDITALQGFLSEGWMDERLFGEAVTLAGKHQNPELLAVLFSWQKQTGCPGRMEDIYGNFD